MLASLLAKPSRALNVRHVLTLMPLCGRVAPHQTVPCQFSGPAFRAGRDSGAGVRSLALNQGPGSAEGCKRTANEHHNAGRGRKQEPGLDGRKAGRVS